MTAGPNKDAASGFPGKRQLRASYVNWAISAPPSYLAQYHVSGYHGCPWTQATSIGHAGAVD